MAKLAISPYFAPKLIQRGPVTRNTHLKSRGPLLRIPPRPVNYEDLLTSLNGPIYLSEFAEFLQLLVNRGIIVAGNARRCSKGVVPFIEGRDVILTNGSILPGSRRLTLISDIYKKQHEVRLFEKTNNDRSKGMFSHAIAKLVLYQLYRAGAWHLPESTPTVTPIGTIDLHLPSEPLPLLQIEEVGAESSSAIPPRSAMLEANMGVTLPLPLLLPPPPPRLASSSRSLFNVPPSIVTNAPPSPYVQLLRTCAMDQELLDHVRERGLLGRPHGIEVLKAFYKLRPGKVQQAQLDPDYFSIDHVISRTTGGLNHTYNYVLMEVGVNSHFGEWWSPEKKRYVGKHAAKIAQGIQCWFATRGSQIEDFSRFDPLRFVETL